VGNPAAGRKGISMSNKKKIINIIIGRPKIRMSKSAIESIGRGGPMKPKRGKGSYKRKAKYPKREETQ